MEPPLRGGRLVDAGERTTVAVIANALDPRTSEVGCASDGCKAANAADGYLSTRWSCKEDLLDAYQIMYTFEEPQDVVRVLIAFYKDEDRTRKLKVKLNGSLRYEVIQSSGETGGFERFELDTEENETLTLEGVDLQGDEWITITEVSQMIRWWSTSEI